MRVSSCPSSITTLSCSAVQPGGLPHTWDEAHRVCAFARGIELFFEPCSSVFPQQKPQLSFKEKEDLNSALILMVDGAIRQRCNPPASDERVGHRYWR